MALKGSKTEKNLLTAFAGESQARNRYTYFSGQARKEGLIQIADIFAETAEQEKEHAKRFFSFLEGGDVEIVAAYPAGVTPGVHGRKVWPPVRRIDGGYGDRNLVCSCQPVEAYA